MFLNENNNRYPNPNFRKKKKKVQANSIYHKRALNEIKLAHLLFS